VFKAIRLVLEVTGNNIGLYVYCLSVYMTVYRKQDTIQKNIMTFFYLL